jgi:hypothetical protein
MLLSPNAYHEADEATQQNSALVDENAASAKTLENQALAMDQRVAYFQIDEGVRNAQSGGTTTQKAVPASSKAKPAITRPAPRARKNAAVPMRRHAVWARCRVNAELDWQEFWKGEDERPRLIRKLYFPYQWSGLMFF